MGKRTNNEIAAMLAAASVERQRVAEFLDHQPKCHDELEGEIVGDKGWHAHFADLLRQYAERVRVGTL
jgi:hypothetical protein